jgi:hypothetical protein
MSDGSDRNDAVLVGRFRREFNAFWNRGDWHDDDRPNDEWDPIADAGISALRRRDLDGAVHADRALRQGRDGARGLRTNGV